jgi:elongator complex protein 3
MAPSRQQQAWQARYADPLDLAVHADTIRALVEAVAAEPRFSPEVYNRLVRRLARQGHPILPKAQLRRGYLALIQAGRLPRDELVLDRLRLKPVRTLSGVAPVTVLTRPHPCPGQCIFCPDDVRMPKSYLPDEPGAMRALMLAFDPFEQARQRVEALRRTGHTVDKVDLLILGGTWHAYPPAYRFWFVRRCFDALNGRSSGPAQPGSAAQEQARLLVAQRRNEAASCRNVGLSIETRPDAITPAALIELRQLGVTRVQVGVQSLHDDLLAANKRGHTAQDVRQAVRLLRASGQKITLHMMQNLFQANPQSDLADFRQLWDDPALRPDEVKLYPTALLRGTELYERYQRGEYAPYGEEELIELLMACKRLVPPYVRINRLMRDISAPEIVAGVTKSNLRQVVQRRLHEAGTPCRCIRCREVRAHPVDPSTLRLEALSYPTDHSHEVFLSAVTPDNRLAGFLRLSLPKQPAHIAEIDGQAIIRQVQVYGLAVALDGLVPSAQPGSRAQHQGIGRHLIEEAQARAREEGFSRLAVIAAVGTRPYYRMLGFEPGELYMSKAL